MACPALHTILCSPSARLPLPLPHHLCLVPTPGRTLTPAHPAVRCNREKEKWAAQADSTALAGLAVESNCNRLDCQPNASLRMAVRTNCAKQNETAQADPTALSESACWRSDITATHQFGKGGQIQLPGEMAVRMDRQKLNEATQSYLPALLVLAIRYNRDTPIRQGRANPTAAPERRCYNETASSDLSQRKWIE
ncbi:hypothetical protein DFH06DRAFT_1294202 [Mycena polygramma]|nr:hypothetical protein DFH06DRAFT_1294202 [Mycena polygramma]